MRSNQPPAIPLWLPHGSPFDSPLQERGPSEHSYTAQSREPRERAGSDYARQDLGISGKSSRNQGSHDEASLEDEHRQPFMMVVEDAEYDPKPVKPRNSLNITRPQQIYHRARRRPLLTRLCRGCFSTLGLVFLCLWVLVKIERSHSLTTRSKLVRFLKETTIYPVSEGVLASAQGNGRTTCPLVYTLDSDQARNRGLTLLTEELQLLGTMLVRVCQCTCSFQQSELAMLRSNNTVLSETPHSRKLTVCNATSDIIDEIFRGAHVVIEGDNGWYYYWFKAMQDAYARTSSHYSAQPTYGVPEGKLLRTILTGTGTVRDSWFQLEGANWSPAKHPLDSVIHAINYIEYKITKRQVGPLGQSVHTDKDPIRKPFDGCIDAPRLP